MNSTHPKLRYLLLQIRNPGDPMLRQEVESFALALRCQEQQISTLDLLARSPTQAELDAADLILIGGSGDYSATSEEPWLYRVLGDLRTMHARRQPMFASCWGFQALARALGGTVVHDSAHAELGTHPVELTEAGRQDPLFGSLGSPFLAQMGHEDCVTVLPPGVTLLASTARTTNQAFRCDGLPIYATQFHPELSLKNMLDRVCAYPRYVERISGLSMTDFRNICRESAEAGLLLERFVRQLFGD